MDQTRLYAPTTDPVTLVRELTHTNERQAKKILACFEFGRAYSIPDVQRRIVTKPSEVFSVVRDIGRLRQEHLVAIYLDSQNGIIAKETISVGGLNTTRTHPREILYPAVTRLALSFILAHNHPSGSLEPSDEDVEFTRSIQRAGELLGIELFDHLIVTRDGFTSLRERGRMQ